MRHKWTCLLGLASLVLIFNGESCILEDRTVDVVVTADIPAEWHTAGINGSGSDTRAVNAAEEVEDALDNLDEDSTIDSILVAGACYEVIANSGHNARRQGSVTVNGHPLLDFDVPNNLTGTTGDTEGATLTLKPAGVDFLNGRLNQYLDSTPRNPALLDFTFAANWTSTPSPSVGDPDNFDWKTCVILQIRGRVELEVPNP